MHPEVSQHEERTGKKVAEYLKEMGCDEVYENVGGYGVVGVIKGKKPGKVVALRADMDALQIQEMNEVPYKSQNDGVMHACGHDTHTAMLLGAAKLLKEHEDEIEGTIKLYNNQVFIADNIKEVIPEFLMLLKGVIDCPDLPLNVSRSALQNDGFVKKISDYITKKVADKLTGMCKTDRETYEKYWDDIAPFIKFGCLKDEKFAEKMDDYIIYKNLDGKYLTLKDCMDKAKEEGHENQIYYVTNEKEQSQYINMFKANGQDAIIMSHSIDNPFISQEEQKHENLKFLRIDADVNDTLREEVKEEDKEALKKQEETLTETFKKALGDDKLQVKVEKLKDAEISSMITLSEETRRMQDMMKMYNMGMDASMFGGSGQVLVLNANNKLVQYVLEHTDGENTPKICEQLYDLAQLSHGSLTPERMTKFIARSNEIMGMMLN